MRLSPTPIGPFGARYHNTTSGSGWGIWIPHSYALLTRTIVRAMLQALSDPPRLPA